MAKIVTFGAAGVDGHALGLAVSHDLGVQAGGDDELSARLQGLVHLSGGQDGTGAHHHLGAGVLHDLHGLGSAGGTEGDLRHGHAARTQGLGQVGRVTLGVVELDDRHDADLGNTLVEFLYTNYLQKYPVPVSYFGTMFYNF